MANAKSKRGEARTLQKAADLATAETALSETYAELARVHTLLACAWQGVEGPKAEVAAAKAEVAAAKAEVAAAKAEVAAAEAKVAAAEAKVAAAVEGTAAYTRAEGAYSLAVQGHAAALDGQETMQQALAELLRHHGQRAPPLSPLPLFPRACG